MRIYIRDGKTFYRADVSPQWAKRHDNGALISCGLTVDDRSAWSGKIWLTRRAFNTLRKKARVVEVSHDQWNHSGCQSYCKLRGNTVCRW